MTFRPLGVGYCQQQDSIYVHIERSNRYILFHIQHKMKFSQYDELTE